MKRKVRADKGSVKTADRISREMVIAAIKTIPRGKKITLPELTDRFMEIYPSVRVNRKARRGVKGSISDSISKHFPGPRSSSWIPVGDGVEKKFKGQRTFYRDTSNARTRPVLSRSPECDILA